jgi:ribonuclease-3
MLVAEWLFRNHGGDDEGRLTRLRAAVVSRRNLCRVAKRLELGTYLRLGRGEERSGGRNKAALLADALEAVIAAVYLDGGLQAAARFVELEIMQGDGRGAGQIAGNELHEIEDWKSAVQEWLQARGESRATYALVEAGGPDHAKQFTVELRVNGQTMAQSTASSKKQAEQDCARIALQQLRARERQ